MTFKTKKSKILNKKCLKNYFIVQGYIKVVHFKISLLINATSKKICITYLKFKQSKSWLNEFELNIIIQTDNLFLKNVSHFLNCNTTLL